MHTAPAAPFSYGAVLDHPGLTTESAVDSYFDRVIWSMGKKEWEKLTAQEKRRFIGRLDAAKGKPPKGPPWGNNKPSM